MSMTPEGKVKQAVKDLLRSHGAYWHMPVQNGMGDPSLDFHVCHLGRYASIETKALGKSWTPRQLLTKEKIERAGGRVFLIDGDLTELKQWLSLHPT
jgi:hypothetical protein